MSSIHYFQRYSQPENVATNNTLLLFSRLYQHSPNKFKGLLSGLLNDIDLEAGVLFNQQSRGKNSVPDGIISQTSFKIIIETKMHQNFSLNQLSAHLNNFENEENQILFSLSPALPNANFLSSTIEKIKQYNQDNNKSINFISTTFQTIIQKFNDAIEEYDFQLIEIINDFENFCISSNLISDIEFRMRVVPCGWTLKENFRFNVYYDPITRGYSEHTYLGIYHNKNVCGIGKIENVITANYLPESQELFILNEVTKTTEQQKQNIIGIIEEAIKNRNDYYIVTNHKFFCVDNFHKTNFAKTSKYPLMGTKLFNLKKELAVENLPETSRIAELLKTAVW